MGLVADGANANVIWKVIEGATYLADVYSEAYAKLRVHIKDGLIVTPCAIEVDYSRATL